MPSERSALIDLLDLERIEINLFRGQSRDLGGHSVYGGQVIAQGLVAAARTVDYGFVHSLHAYFLRPGDMDHPIVYDVDRVRNGLSFCTRRVQAIQHGKVILTMSASFQRDESGYDHQAPMPEVLPPEALATGLELRAKILEPVDAASPEERKLMVQPMDLEFRVESLDQTSPPDADDPTSRIQYFWFRSTKPVPKEAMLHRCMLAFASDFGLIGTALKPHGQAKFPDPDLFVASLDHAIWFHRSFRVDDWLLYHMDTPSAQGGRGLTRGLIFDRGGRLVASTAQEGLIRMR